MMQPMPKAGKQRVLPHVLRDLKARVETGTLEYGQPLMTHDGRKGDLYEELLDAVLYKKKEDLEDRDNLASLLSVGDVLSALRALEKRAYEPGIWCLRNGHEQYHLEVGTGTICTKCLHDALIGGEDDL